MSLRASPPPSQGCSAGLRPWLGQLGDLSDSGDNLGFGGLGV